MNGKPVMLADIEGKNFGPATRGTSSQTLSAVIGDAFGGGSPVTFSGDWAFQNTFDGFDRGIASTNAVGETALGTFDPGGRAVAAQIYGFPGGPTPTDRGGSNNVLLASGEARFDEAGQQFGTQIWEHDGVRRQLREKRHLQASGDGMDSTSSPRATAIIVTVLTQMAYDANSNTIWLVDSNGGTTGWLYDLLDRNTVMTFHDGSTRTNAFNAASDVIGYTDENGSHFANTPDVLGRTIEVNVTAATGVLGPTFQYFQFDGLSRLALGDDVYSGTTAGFTRDSINRILEEQQTLADDTRYVTHNAWTGYSGAGFTFPDGRRISKAFDALYRKNGISETADGSSIAAWQFFGGRTATVTLGNGIVTSFMNNAQTRSAVQQGQTTPAWGSISTDQLGYDGSARPIGKRHFLSGSVLAGFTTAYDFSSNKLFERALHAESRSALYANDSMDRLLQYNRGVLATGGASITTPIALPNTDSQRAYTLDALGNWPNTLFIPEGGASELEVRTHNKLNQVTARGVAPASTPILYDHGNNTGANAARGNGNIIDDGTLLLGFDALNRLIEVRRKSDNAVIGTYLYDVLGRRVYKFVTAGGLSGAIPNGESRYLLDGQQIVEELGPAAPPAIQYVWGQYIDELIQLKALTTIGPQPLAAGNYYLLSDLLYRSAALTNNTGGIVEAFDADAYGNTIPFSAGGGMGGAWFSNADTQAAYSACRYVFTGREYDAETGAYYMRARYYEASLGRFVSRDPIGYKRGGNLLEYVTSRPTLAPDPHGLDIVIMEPGLQMKGGSWKDTLLRTLGAMCPCIELYCLPVADNRCTVAVRTAPLSVDTFCKCYAGHAGGCKLIYDLIIEVAVMLSRGMPGQDSATRQPSGDIDVRWTPSVSGLISRTIFNTGVASDYEFGGLVSQSALGHELFHAWDFDFNTRLSPDFYGREDLAVRFENQLYIELGGTGALRSRYDQEHDVYDYGYPVFSDDRAKVDTREKVLCDCKEACREWSLLMKPRGKCS